MGCVRRLLSKGSYAERVGGGSLGYLPGGSGVPGLQHPGIGGQHRRDKKTRIIPRRTQLTIRNNELNKLLGRGTMA
ncbi:hypothetical protein H8958_016296 [Nasalis larvatus]